MRFFYMSSIERVLDIVLATIFIAILSPLLLVVSLVLRLTGNRRVLLRRKYVGKDRREFIRYTFDTDDRSFNPDGSPAARFGTGKYLRIFRLHRLPLLLNVLRGDMSLVGPHPVKEAYLKYYTDEQLDVFTVRPGIFSPRSFRSNADSVSEDALTRSQFVRYYLPELIDGDRAYLKKKSILFDLKLLLVGLMSAVIANPLFLEKDQPRRILIYTAHFILCILAYWLAFLLRFDGDIPLKDPVNSVNYHDKFLRTLPLMLTFRFAGLFVYGLFQGFLRYTGIYDFFSLLKAVTLGSGLMFLANFLFLSAEYPDAVILIEFFIILIMLSGLRVFVLFFRDAILGKLPGEKNDRALVVGLTDSAESVLRELTGSSASGMEPVGLIDPRSRRIGYKIHGVPVRGGVDDVERLIREKNIHCVILADSGLSSRARQTIVDYCTRHNVQLRKIPAITEIVSGRVRMTDIKEVQFEDLLGRKPTKLDTELVSAEIRDKVVFVTGAGGSIGSQLCREVAFYKPRKMILFEINEEAVFEMHRQLARNHPDIEILPVTGDITDRAQVHGILTRYKPEDIYHCAAYKHVPLMEDNPVSAIRNNTLGTRTLVEEADNAGVEKFVMISTDKAVNPCNVMGASKRLAEKVIQDISSTAQTRFVIVRFGNVLGSSGSVIPIFKKQIAEGGPVTVTHPDIIRYFMSIPEAVQLVLQAGAMGEGGDIFVLEMGEPVKIADMASQLIRLSGFRVGKDIAIEYTGLRPGEKMYEELVYKEEELQKTKHPKINRVKPDTETNGIQINKILEQFQPLVESYDPEGIRDVIRKIFPEIKFCDR